MMDKSNKGNKNSLQRTFIALVIVALVLIFAAAVANGRRRAAASITPPAAEVGTELADVLADGEAGEDPASDSDAVAAALPGGSTSTPAAVARPATNGARVRPLTEAVNIRSGPGTLFEVIGTLEHGETAAALARTQTGDWFLIRKDSGLTGWVAANVIEFIEGERNAIGVAATIPAPTRTATEPPPPPPPPDDPLDDDPEPPQPPATPPPVTQPPSAPTAEPPVMKTPTVNPYP